MLNTVISPLYADFLLLFMARECTPFYFSLLRRRNAKEQNEHPVTEEGTIP